jgi:CxxC motif-containing protein
MQVEFEEKKAIKVTGNSCKRGATYARKEVTNPTRILTTTVEVDGSDINVVSVKTERDIPKDKMFQCIEVLKGLKVKAPIKIGDIIVKNIADTGVDVVATKEVN